MASIADLLGKRVGMLVVSEILDARKTPAGRSLGLYVSCRCDCGNSKEIRGNSLTQGLTTSCGCFQPVRGTDLAERRFGKLTVVKRVASRKHKNGADAKWLCHCDCGGAVEVIARSLIHGGTGSCGCICKSAGGLCHTPEHRAAAQNKRRARKAGAGGSFTRAEIDALYERQRGCCAVCKGPRELREMHRDHMMPLALGGDNWISNIQLLCRGCNQSKHARHPIAFMQSRGFLL